MLKNLSLSIKLYIGFGVVLTLLVLLSGLVYKNLVSINHSSTEALTSTDYDKFIVQKEVDHLKWVSALENLFLENLDKANVQEDHTKCGLGQFIYGEDGKMLAEWDEEIGVLIENIKEPHQHLHESAIHINEVWQKNHEGLTTLLNNRLEDHHNWASEVSKMIIEKKSNDAIQLDHTKCAFGNFLVSDEYKAYSAEFPAFRDIMEEVKHPHKLLHDSAEKIISELNKGNSTKATDIYQTETVLALTHVGELFHDAIEAESNLETAQVHAREIHHEQTLPALAIVQSEFGKISDILNEKSTHSKESLQSRVKSSQVVVGVLSLVSLLLGCVISIILSRSITKPINSAIEVITSGAQEVSAASGQLSSTSQQMAEGSSEQASSLEEISSSLEEMTSMTRQNTENAKQADSMSGEAQQAAEKGADAMMRMDDAISKMKASSDETAKIIKTIDEIAFQTNLLALNAAVEAARAGEAGMGFAVVAEEVRNLAQRSAEAAKNTAALIEESQANAENGVSVTKEVGEILSEIAQNSQKVKNLISEVSSASEEQSQGIDQINTAITQMDKVTQSNAANAEESASASEELSSQSIELNNMVGMLIEVVNGRDNNSKGSNRVKERMSNTASNIQNGSAHRFLPGRGAANSERSSFAQHVSKTDPENMIPLQDDDFEEF
ncbi:methyl-accepting chemotaxis protein [Candidatus Latescibacterota bacterium]